MKPDITKLVEPTREDLIHAIRHAMLYRRGSKRRHDFDAINAKVAAEVLIDGLAANNYVIMRGPPGQAAAAGRLVQTMWSGGSQVVVNAGCQRTATYQQGLVSGFRL